MALWVAVHGFVNGEPVDEAILNRPVGQLRERTDFLFRRVVDALGVDALQSLRLVDVALVTTGDNIPHAKDFVYLDPTTRAFAKARADVDFAQWAYQPNATSAFSLGILFDRDEVEPVGTVVLSGKLALWDLADWDLAELLEPGETFRTGPYYLSSITAGKMTAYPKGPAIYLGYFVDNEDNPGHGGYAVLSPQYKDVGTSHIHRAFPLKAKPAGTQALIGEEPLQHHKLLGYEPPAAYEVYHGAHTDPGPTDYPLVDGMAGYLADSLAGLTIYKLDGSGNRIESAVITNNTSSDIYMDPPLTWTRDDRYYIQCRTRLVLLGDYNGRLPSVYTLKLVAGDGSSLPVWFPNGFDDVWLLWQSDDPEEDPWDGTAPVPARNLVRVTAYEQPIAIGTKGVIAYLENALEDADDPYWDHPESGFIAGGGFPFSPESRRVWTFEVPEQTTGWVARKVRDLVTDMSDRSGLGPTDKVFTMQIFGGPLDYSDDRSDDVLTAVAGKIYKIGYALDFTPDDGNVLTIDTITYEFDNNDAVTLGNIAVPIAADDPDQTYDNLLQAILEQHQAAVTPVHNPWASGTYHYFMLCLSDYTLTVSGTISNTEAGVVDTMPGYTGSAVIGSGALAKLLPYDKYNKTVLPDTTSWDMVSYWAVPLLSNNLRLMLVPYAEDKDAATINTLYEGDKWQITLVDEAPNTKFMYTLGMDPSLKAFFPPIPLGSASLVINGLEMDSAEIFGAANASYLITSTGLYWYYDAFGRIPWPADWNSQTGTGSPERVINSVLWITRMKAISGVVTSLRPAPDAPVRITRCGTNEPATTGDLAINVDLALKDEDRRLAGHQVYKRIEGNKLLKGPVVSRLIAGPGIAVSSPSGVEQGYGDVTVSLIDAGYSGDFEDIALENAKQELIGMFPYIRLLGWNSTGGSNIPSGFVARFQVPTGIAGEFQVLLYFTVFGEAGIANVVGSNQRLYAGLEFSYNVLRDYQPRSETGGSLLNALISPATDPIPLTVPFGKMPLDAVEPVYRAYDPMIIHNNPKDTADDPARIVQALGMPFPKAGDRKGTVAPGTLPLRDVTVMGGSQVAIRIRRASVPEPGLEYTGSLGFLKLRWQLAPVKT